VADSPGDTVEQRVVREAIEIPIGEATAGRG
jgi:hypothetical protein